ncbi:MAG: hypothetical protein V3R34_01770 [Hyphomicrobium sp.]
MRFKTYVDTTGCTLRSIQLSSGVSYALVKSLYGGLVLRRWDKANAISDACDGKVSIEELCTPGPRIAVTKAKKAKKQIIKPGKITTKKLTKRRIVRAASRSR